LKTVKIYLRKLAHLIKMLTLLDSVSTKGNRVLSVKSSALRDQADSSKVLVCAHVIPSLILVKSVEPSARRLLLHLNCRRMECFRLKTLLLQLLLKKLILPLLKATTVTSSVSLLKALLSATLSPSE
jgi:hypothetical protein